MALNSGRLFHPHSNREAKGGVKTMTERSDRVTCAVATANGFAMSIRISQATACANRTIDEKAYEEEFVRWWWEAVRVLGTSVLGFMWW
jgi:hypothetical protein